MTTQKETKAQLKMREHAEFHKKMQAAGFEKKGGRYDAKAKAQKGRVGDGAKRPNGDARNEARQTSQRQQKRPKGKKS